MKVTVITPCFNPGRFLLPMLESVATQGDVVAKHIVMDGGSTDGSVAIMEGWAKEHPWFEFVSEKDNGQSDACQKALSKVETEYFCWLNADDKLCEGALEALIKAVVEDYERPTIVYGDYFRIDANGNVIAERRQPSYNYWDCLNGYLFVQNVAALFNTNKLKQAGGFDSSLRFVMDYDIILKLGKTGQVKHVRRFCGAFRIHPASKTMTIDEVCQKETEALRTKYGVSRVRAIRFVNKRLSQLRVLMRMIKEGCLKGRLY